MDLTIRSSSYNIIIIIMFLFLIISNSRTTISAWSSNQARHTSFLVSNKKCSRCVRPSFIPRWMAATPVATSRSLSNNHSSSPPSSLQEETAAAGDQHNNPPILWNEDNWRTNPLINPTLDFPTLVVSARELQLWMNHPLLQEHLAKPTNSEILRHIHPRIKTIRNYNDTHKLLLLKPVVRTTNTNHNDAIDDDEENDQGSKEFIQELSSLVEACNNERKKEDTTDTKTKRRTV